MAQPEHDVIVIGGGPAGATAARQLARGGLDVQLFERAAFPRPHVGESFLPRSSRQLRDLGLHERLAALPQMEKPGVEFVLGHGRDRPSVFRFAQRLGPGDELTFNMERAPFDRVLLDAAREAGASVAERTAVRRITRLADGEVAVEVGGAEHRARYLVDASGQATLVARHLRTRRALPAHRKVACFGHFRGVPRRAGRDAGIPTIVMCREGWFWLIPIDPARTSVGLVLDEEAARRTGVPVRGLLEWAIARCPEMARRCAAAVYPPETFVNADFSYRCRPEAGPGYFLVGDAAAFVDPIFSTGLCLGMMSAERVADGLVDVIRRGRAVRRLRRDHVRYVRRSTAPLFTLIDLFYDDGFRELFLEGKGPLSVHRAIIELLAGEVFPSAP